MEMASGGRRERRRNLPLDGRIGPALAVQARHAGQQRLRVGMVRGGIEIGGIRGFDHAPKVHHHHALREVPDHAQVVADEQVGQSEALTQVEEQVQHLRLDRDVERGHRFVADQEGRLHRQSARNADARPLPAGELVRVAPAVGRVEADLPEHFTYIIFYFKFRNKTVNHRSLADDFLHAHARIQRSKGILENHLRTLRARRRLALVEHAPGAGFDQPAGDPPERGFAAARFPDQAHHLAALDLEAHAVHRVHRLLGDIRAKRARDLLHGIEPLAEALRDVFQR